MKNYLCLLLALCLVLGSLTGCLPTSQPTESPSGTPENGSSQSSQQGSTHGQQSGSPTISVPEDYFDLLCENCNMDFYLRSGGAQFVVFWLISAKDLQKQSLTLSTDLGSQAEQTIPAPIAVISLPESVFLAYQGISWSELADNPKGDETLAQYRAAYQALGDDLPSLYCYMLMIPFKNLGISVSDDAPTLIKINTITATIDGHSKTYNVGLLQFRNEKAHTEGSYSALSQKSGGATGYNTDPSVNGEASLPEVRFVAKNDVVLQRIYAAGDTSIKVRNVSIKVTYESGETYNMRWDGVSPLEIDAGSTIELSVRTEAPNLSNTLSGNAACHFVLEYTDGDELRDTQFQLSWMVFTNPFDIYAKKTDNIDLLPYYLEYGAAANT